MFGRLRFQLTIWYVCALAVTLLAVGALVYWLVARSLDSQINQQLADVNHLSAQVLSATPSPDGDGSGPGLGPTPVGEGDETEEYDEYTAAFADRLLGNTGDVFPVVLDTQGAVIANPRGLPIEELPVDAALTDTDAGGGSNRRDVTAGENHVRIYTQEVVDGGRRVGYVMAVTSLDQRNSDLRRLLILLSIGGAVGLVLAGAGGLWVAQIAIRPVRRAFERQREFVADASHELRTPLTVVRANAESLVGKARTPTEREALQDIADESARMGRLVSDLLTLAEADRAQLELRREPLDLADVVRAAERTARLLAEERGLSLTSRVEHVPLEADADRLHELLLILIDNALRYTPAGGAITVASQQDGNHAELIVEDTGVGIAHEHLGRIFDRFYRVDKARARAEGGLGLGLPIARAIVQAHGGAIHVSSTPGRGTTVSVSLPAHPKAATPDAPAVDRPAPEGRAGVSQARE